MAASKLFHDVVGFGGAAKSMLHGMGRDSEAAIGTPTAELVRG